MPKLRLIEAIAHACKVANEDLFDCNTQAAWIFDGVTGIGTNVIASAHTDPHWLVHAVNEAMVEAWRGDIPTQALCLAAARRAIDRFAEAAPQSAASPVDLPTACLLMARLWEGRLEVSMAGDCTLLLAGAGGVAEFGLDLGDIALPVRRELARLTAAGVPPADLIAHLAPLEREVRSQANIDGGYAIVDLTTRWPDRLEQRRVDVAPGERLLITTDGLYRLVDTFGRYTAETLMTAAVHGGLELLYEELRALEAEDEGCEAFPRAKVRDDVAAALLVVEA